ncbi:unnamed protein product, partial [Cyprideis torosa]
TIYFVKFWRLESKKISITLHIEACPSGFEFNSELGKCYLFSTTTETWTAAEDHCASLREGVHLASIHSTSEMDYLISRNNRLDTKLCEDSAESSLHVHFAPSSTEIGTGNRYWVGGSDAATEGTWTWIDGSPFDFEDWYPNDPNGET